jgi:hypothetical protein
MITWTKETFITYTERWCAGDVDYLKSIFTEDSQYHLNTGQDYVGIDAVLGFNAYMVSIGEVPDTETSEFSLGKDSMHVVFPGTIIAKNDFDELFGIKDVKKGDKCWTTLTGDVSSILHIPLIWSICWMRTARLKMRTLSWRR